MKKPLVLLLIPILTIAGLYVAPAIVRPAHAAQITGVVCVAGKLNTTCPVTTPTLAGPPPGLNSFFYADILVNASAALNGFDITLLTDRSVLVPSGVILGSLLANTHEIVKCVDGVNKLGSTSCPSTDAPGTIEYGVTGDITPSSPVTGFLFRANFTVVANSARTPITFQTGCANTSVPGGVCVTITSGGTAFVPETSQTAKFSNLPYFELLPSIATLQVSKGDTDLSASLDVASLNGFGSPTQVRVDLTTSVSPLVSNGPIFTVAPKNQNVTPSCFCFSTLNVTVLKLTPVGTYTLNITGTSGTLPPDFVTIRLTVPLPDFSIAANPKSLFFNVTVSGNATITLSSLGNFNATGVSLSAKTNSPLVTASLRNSTLNLASKGTNATKLTVKAAIYGLYIVNVTATYGSLSHTLTITVDVVDYFLQVSSSVLTVVNGSSAIESIAVNIPDIYNVTVTITNTHVDQITSDGTVGPSSGLNVTCSPTKIVIVSSGGTKGTGATNCLVKALAIGDYFVTVTAVGGNQSRTSVHGVTFPVAVVAPNFSINLSTTVTTVPVGSSAALNVTIIGKLGLNDSVTITLSLPPSSPSTLSVSPANYLAVLTSSSRSASVLATITTGSTTPPGDYNLTITGSGRRSTPTTVTVTALVIVVQTASPHNLALVSVIPSTTSTTVGSNITITINIQNRGKLTENATIVAIVSDETVGTQNETNLAPGQNATAHVIWYTTGFSPGAYVIGGKVLALNGQTNTTYSTIRFATPVTLSAASSPGLPSYALPLAAVAAIIVVAVALGLFLYSRRRPKPA